MANVQNIDLKRQIYKAKDKQKTSITTIIILLNHLRTIIKTKLIEGNKFETERQELHYLTDSLLIDEIKKIKYIFEV